jgi:hypothetical protein
MLLVSLDCPRPVSCVSNVTSFPGLSSSCVSYVASFPGLSLVTLGTRHTKIDTGNIGPKSQKDKPVYKTMPYFTFTLTYIFLKTK